MTQSLLRRVTPWTVEKTQLYTPHTRLTAVTNYIIHVQEDNDVVQLYTLHTLKKGNDDTEPIAASNDVEG